MNYSHSGVGNAEFGDIEKNSLVTISGVGEVSLGSIGENTTVVKNGVGTLRIKGAVSENVIFKINGVGTVIFDVALPSSVIKTMQRSRLCKILIAEKEFKNSDTTPNLNMFSNPTSNKRQPVSLLSRDGKIFYQIGSGETKVYRGVCAQVKNNELYIDEQKVIENDTRFITSLSSNEDQKTQIRARL